MAKIEATFSGLKKCFLGFKEHASKTDKNTRYYCLDIIYAIECGIKALTCSKKTCPLHTDYQTHDLHDIIRKALPYLQADIPGYLTATNSLQIQFKDVHQALRYGTQISQDNLESFIDKIEKSYDKIEQEIRRM